jgi:hypothetical protein
LDQNTAALLESIAATKQLASALRQNSAFQARLIVLLERLIKRLRRPPNPRPIALTITKELNDMLNFRIDLPAEPDGGDVHGGKLSVTVGSNTTVNLDTAKGQAAVEGFSGEHGDKVEASFVYVDDAGNLSATPAVLNVTLADTVPPADPTSLGLTVTGETA